MRVALGDVASVESLNLLIAMERAGERGVPTEMAFFNSEDVAVQAVLSDEADIGFGAPYAFIENSNAPIRMFYRMSALLFFPVVNSQAYSDCSNRDGEEITVHSRGSDTEPLMRLIEQIRNIEYSTMSYVPALKRVPAQCCRARLMPPSSMPPISGCCRSRVRANSRACRSTA